jgi:ribonuclease HI
MNPEELLLKIEAGLVETINSYLRKASLVEGSFSIWDGLIKKAWPNLINPSLVYSKQNKEARKVCKWNPPPKGWTKLNFDGAARGNPGTTGVGSIINNDKGEWLAKKALSINPTSNNLAELNALKGLLLCIHLGVSNIYIEGDSQIVLNAIRKKSTPNWVLNSKLEDIINLMTKFEDIRIEHIFREGNLEADSLENLGADGHNILEFNNNLTHISI